MGGRRGPRDRPVARRGCREGRPARADGGADALRRQRSAGRDRAHPPRPARRDRHPRPQGPEHDRPGPGRRRADPDLDGAQARAGRHAGEEPQRRQHLRPRQGRRRHGDDRAGDARPPAAAAQAAAEPGGRLLPAQPLRGARRAGGLVEDPRAAAGRDRLGVAAGRRHRHHEHHAGLGHRAHARDRPQDGGRRARSRHPAAVPGRGGDAGADRRHRRASPWARYRRSSSATSPAGGPR